MKRATFLLVILIGLLSVGLIYSIRDAMHKDVQIAKQSETLEVQKQMLYIVIWKYEDALCIFGMPVARYDIVRQRSKRYQIVRFVEWRG